MPVSNPSDDVNLDSLLRPTGTIAETYPRNYSSGANVAMLVAQRIQLAAVALQVGDVVTAITFESGTTALATPAHQWACLVDSGTVVRAVSADDTSGAWAADSSKTFTMGTPYTVPTIGIYYIGLLIDATTVPSLRGLSSSASMYGTNAPKISCTANTTATVPIGVGSSTAAFVSSGNRFYARIT